MNDLIFFGIIAILWVGIFSILWRIEKRYRNELDEIRREGTISKIQILGPQTCKRCGRTQYVIWGVSDEIWEKFCSKTGWDKNKTICLECFAELVGFVDVGNVDDCIYEKSLWENIGIELKRR